MRHSFGKTRNVDIHYEVVDAFGAGGMREVYRRARDTKLDEDEALKLVD